MEKFKGYKGPYTLGSIQVNASNAIGQNIDAVQNGVESFATFWLWDRKPDERELATMNVMISGPQLLNSLWDILTELEDVVLPSSMNENILNANRVIQKALGIPTNSTDQFSQSRIMEATKGLNLEEK